MTFLKICIELNNLSLYLNGYKYNLKKIKLTKFKSFSSLLSKQVGHYANISIQLGRREDKLNKSTH